MGAIIQGWSLRVSEHKKTSLDRFLGFGFNESVQGDYDHWYSDKRQRARAGTCQVVEERAYWTRSQQNALIFAVCVVLEFVVCPIRV